MHAQYFHYIIEHGIEEARQMAYVVEQGHDPVHSEPYRTSANSLTSRIELEAAKQLAKTRLDRATNKRRKNGGAGDATKVE